MTIKLKNLIITISGSAFLGLVLARYICPTTDLLPNILR